MQHEKFPPPSTWALPVLLFFILVVINSCKKSYESNDSTSTQNSLIITKINSWLDANKKLDSSQRTKDIVESIRSSLDFNKMSFQKLNAKEKFCIIPLLETFKSDYNIGKYKISNMVFILNEIDSIRKGNIVQFLPNNGQQIKTLPSNTFYKIFNHEEIEQDGKFSFLNIKDRLIWEIGYKNKVPYSYGKVEARENSTDSNIYRSNGECIDWFLITTIYYTDGSVETFEEYLGTTCGDMCQEVRVSGGRVYRVNCGGGGGGGEIIDLPPKPVDWTVGKNPNDFWLVKSFETLNGQRTSPGPDGGYFTGISHNNSGIINNVQNEPGLPYGTWTQFQAVANLLNSNGIAKSTVKGKVAFSSFADVYLDNFRIWFFYVEYP